MLQREIEYKRIHIENDERNNRIIYGAKCPFSTKRKGSIGSHLVRSKHREIALSTNLGCPYCPRSLGNLQNLNKRIWEKVCLRPPNKSWYQIWLDIIKNNHLAI